MGAQPSSPRQPHDTAEYLISTLVGDKSFPLDSDFWHKLLQLPPIDLHWPTDRVRETCQIFEQNNHRTRHLAKILIHLVWSLQEFISTSGATSIVYLKAVNAVYVSSVFLKYFIESSPGNGLHKLHLSLEESEPMPDELRDENIENLVIKTVLSFIGYVDVSPNTYLLHQELLNFMLVAMSTQLLYGPSHGPTDINPFIDAAMSQESSLFVLVVQKLLLNYITRPYMPSNNASYPVFSEGSQPGVLQKVGSAAASFVSLPLNYLVSPSVEGPRHPLADCSLYVLLILANYRKCAIDDESITLRSENGAALDSLSKEKTYFSVNPYCKALENAKDLKFDHADVEGDVHGDSSVRLSFTSLFDGLGMFLTDESAALLLYTLVHGNSDFLEYALVRTDIDILLMPILETLYNASKRTPNHIYILLIVLLILSQDASLNAIIHKMTLPSVPWYQDHLLYQTSLGSLMVIILIRTVKYNLSKLQDLYLHTTCLAILANMAPHVHRLSAYASQRLVSLFYMLSRKYNKLAESIDGKMVKDSFIEENNCAENTTAEIHIYTDFLRIVLEIINGILTYALPRNPEVVYAVMQRQEVFQPFKYHPRFNELIDNLYMVLDFFNSRVDDQTKDGDGSIEEILQLITINCRSWRGEGMKMFAQLHFSYEQEIHPEEFFTPYIWQLALSHCGFSFDPSAINLFRG